MHTVSQLVAEILSGKADAGISVSQAVIESLSGHPNTAVSHVVIETLSQNIPNLPPIEIPPVEDTTHALLLEVTECRRALSGNYGDYEVGRFTITITDINRHTRELLKTVPGKYFLNRPVEVRMASLAAVKAHASSRRIAYGIVNEPPGFDGLTVTLKCVDFVGSKLWTNE